MCIPLESHESQPWSEKPVLAVGLSQLLQRLLVKVLRLTPWLWAFRPKAQGTLRRSMRKEWKSRRMGRTAVKCCLLDMTGLCSPELTAAVVACTR